MSRDRDRRDRTHKGNIMNIYINKNIEGMMNTLAWNKEDLLEAIEDILTAHLEPNRIEYVSLETEAQLEEIDNNLIDGIEPNEEVNGIHYRVMPKFNKCYKAVNDKWVEIPMQEYYDALMVQEIEEEMESYSEFFPKKEKELYEVDKQMIMDAFEEEDIQIFNLIYSVGNDRGDGTKYYDRWIVQCEVGDSNIPGWVSLPTKYSGNIPLLNYAKEISLDILQHIIGKEIFGRLNKSNEKVEVSVWNNMQILEMTDPFTSHPIKIFLDMEGEYLFSKWGNSFGKKESYFTKKAEMETAREVDDKNRMEAEERPLFYDQIDS